MEHDPRRRLPHRRRSAGRRSRRLLGARSRERYGLDLTVVNARVDPTFALHDARSRRQDPHGLLVALRDGERWSRCATTSTSLTGNDADADRHGIVTPDAGLMNPNHYLAVAIDYLFAHRAELARRAASARRWSRRR